MVLKPSYLPNTPKHFYSILYVIDAIQLTSWRAPMPSRTPQFFFIQCCILLIRFTRQVSFCELRCFILAPSERLLTSSRWGCSFTHSRPMLIHIQQTFRYFFYRRKRKATKRVTKRSLLHTLWKSIGRGNVFYTARLPEQLWDTFNSN